MSKQFIVLISLILSFLTAEISAQTEARLLRFPAIHGNQIVFSYAGDLYAVERTGGVARKLSNDVGHEIFARFSPDGKHIAFTGQYDGNTEVYLMPATGGEPQRLTYTATLGRDDLSDRMGPNNIVMTWKPDGSGVVYRSRKTSFNSFKGQLYVAALDGSPSEELPFSVGSWCSYSPDGKRLAMNQVFREFRTWKYYRGGMADDIYIYDFATRQMENITNNPAQDIMPMWHGNRIFFLSDRDRTMNIFEYNLESKRVRKVTNFTDYDVKFPSIGADAIVFEKGGYIYEMDINSGHVSKVSIYIHDDGVIGRNEWVDASKYIAGGDYDVAPDGARFTVSARGDVWSIPAKEGITRNLTSTSGVHERAVTWSPDGKYIAYLSDASGEFEVYIQKHDGSEPAIQLTSGADTYKYGLTWSPDSRKIAWSDKKLRLSYVDIQTKKVTQVDKGRVWEHGTYKWSPDSKWLVFSRQDDEFRSRVYLHSTASGQTHVVTEDWYDAGSPEFSPDGKYLFFVSERDFNPTYSQTEWNHSYSDMARVYFVTLAKSTPSPLALKNDEVTVTEESTAAKTEDKAPASKKGAEINEAPKAESKSMDMMVDIDGIFNRVVSLPVSPGNYFNLQAVDDAIYYVHSSTKTSRPVLKVYNLKDKKESEIGEFSSYVISANRKKMLLAKDGQYSIVDLPKDKANTDKKADLSNMKVWLDRKAEWNQIFDEAWRQMRDFFYDPGMHGVDWPAMREKYRPLVAHVNHRHDLSYIIGEMIGELNIGHAYVGGGDAPKPDRVQLGLLGAKLSRDASGYFRIDKILKGENWSNATRSPLTEVGVDVKAGDYIIAVNGNSTTTVKDIYQLLVNTAGTTVELTVNSKASADGSRKVLVKPTADESALYYLDWVRGNIAYVNEKTNGEVGYIHIPDMGVAGLNEFVKYFYPQLTKKGLIIDDRGNGGGNVSPMIIERLRREQVFYSLPRNVEVPSTNPTQMHYGPKVLLLDQYSASDGDIFPYRFRHSGLGKLIGRRSWGGIVGIRGSLPFVDGGTLNRPEFASYAADGSEWPVEGYGVDPDIEVFNNPADEYLGKDDQLDKAIEVILEEVKSRKDIPAPPAYPKKN